MLKYNDFSYYILFLKDNMNLYVYDIININIAE